MGASLRSIIAVLLLSLILAVAIPATPSGTHAYFSDTTSTTGNISAADSFDGTPSGSKAFDDANNNGIWDDGETTYNKNELRNFQDQSVNLVIPADVGEIKDNKGVSITANKITSSVDYESGKGTITLEATGGQLDVGDANIGADGEITLSGEGVAAENAALESWSEGVTITSNGQLDGSGISVVGDLEHTISADNIDIAGADIESWSRGVSIEATAGNLQAQNVNVTGSRQISLSGNSVEISDGFVESWSSGVDVSATAGNLHSSSSTIQGQRNMELSSTADMDLNESSIQSWNNEILADLEDSSTLYVHNAEFVDQDNTLEYSPSNVTVIGSPATGNITPQ